MNLRRIYGLPDVVGLCLGTNGPAERKLKWAQKDALDVAHVLSGARGTIPSVACLREPNVEDVRRALSSLAGRRPHVLVLWISGHGTPNGVVFSDGVMSFVELAARVAAVGADHSLLGLDVCFSGMYIVKEAALGDVVVGAVGLEYFRALAEATPSARVICSVGANRLAAEGGNVMNGHMTAAFLEASCVVPGGFHGLITDSPLFDAIRTISVRRWRQLPHALGLTTDFPVLYDQRYLVGQAAICRADIVGFDYVVGALVDGRRGVPTRMTARLLNAHGVPLHETEWRFVPYQDSAVIPATFSAPPQALHHDAVSLAGHFGRGAVPVRWLLTVEDLRGRVLAERQDAALISTKVAGGRRF